MTPTTEVARAIVARLETDAAVYDMAASDLTDDIRDDDTPPTTRREMEEARDLERARARVLRDVLRWLPRELAAVEVAMAAECERMDTVLETVA